jgi:integrase
MAERFSEKWLETLRATGKRQRYSDSLTTGLVLDVQTSGRKSYGWFRSVRAKPIYRAIDTDSLKVARQWAEEYNAKLSAWRNNQFTGPNPFQKVTREEIDEAAAPTFAQLAAAYLAKTNEHGNQPGKNAQWVIRARLLPAWSKKRVDEITVKDVAAVKIAQGENLHTGNRCVEVARAIFNWCAGNKEDSEGECNFWPLAKNPAANVSTPKEDPRKRYLLGDELLRFNAQLGKETNVDLRDILTLVLATWCRKDEILSMEWAAIDWERQTFHIPDPKNDEPRDVPLDASALFILEERRKHADADARFVFPGSGASGHRTDIPKEPWKRFKKAAKLTNLHVHDLRRTSASYAAQGGVPLQHIAAQLGHSKSNLQSVAVYAYLQDDAQREAGIRAAQNAGAHERGSAEAASRSVERNRKATPTAGLGARRFFCACTE